VTFGRRGVVVVVVALGFRSPRQPAPTPGATTASAAAPPASTPAPIPGDLIGPGNTPTPDSLAVALLRGELPRRADDVACIAVDGADASPTLLAALPLSPGAVVPVSPCPAAAEGKRAAQGNAVGKCEANQARSGADLLQRHA